MKIPWTEICDQLESLKEKGIKLNNYFQLIKTREKEGGRKSLILGHNEKRVLREFDTHKRLKARAQKQQVTYLK